MMNKGPQEKGGGSDVSNADLASVKIARCYILIGLLRFFWTVRTCTTLMLFDYQIFTSDKLFLLFLCYRIALYRLHSEFISTAVPREENVKFLH